jgi:uncharacterized sulfatase
MIANRERSDVAPLFQAAVGKRPEEELYALKDDPEELTNVATRPEYAEAKAKLRAQLDQWMTTRKDPRAGDAGSVFDRYPYYGGRPKP